MADNTVTSAALLDNEQTAELLGIRPNTLEIWRCRGRGPRFVKLGQSQQAPIRYQRSAVIQWLEQQSFASTSAYSPAAQNPAKPRNLRSAPASV